MSDASANLLLAAHGTRSAEGLATLAAIADAVCAARPGLAVWPCFLDVATPSLRDVLALHGTEPGIVVPLLLSAGYHVHTDIPAAVAEYPAIGVAAHLGPDPAVVSALADRLGAARGGGWVATTVLVAVGSSRSGAQAEVREVAASLADRLGRSVAVLVADDGLRPALEELPGPLEVAPYLIAPGDFAARIATATAGLGVVAEPIGDHPALVTLALDRYDDAVAATSERPPPAA